jgi:17 kDa outer membrane surface antigen
VSVSDPYSGTCSPWHRCRPLLARLLVTVSLGLGSGACSLSYKLGATGPQDSGLPPDGDLVFARAAAMEALTRHDKDVSVPWENPGTGARGTVTPIASVYTKGGVECRAFLASYVQDNTETWIEGEACRGREGKWEVRNLKPWKHS